jgi:hypothetical protein
VNLRKQARGRGCQVRIPGVCNHNSETVILAHYRLAGISGMGVKSPDAVASWCCSDCHSYVDTHHDAETKLALAEGVFRTLAQLIREGVVKA